jgi:hypothetical protein
MLRTLKGAQVTAPGKMQAPNPRLFRRSHALQRCWGWGWSSVKEHVQDYKKRQRMNVTMVRVLTIQFNSDFLFSSLCFYAFHSFLFIYLFIF